MNYTGWMFVAKLKWKLWQCQVIFDQKINCQVKDGKRSWEATQTFHQFFEWDQTHAFLYRENQALCPPMLGMQLHTQRCLYRSQECSWEMRFTRGLLQSIDVSMWSCLPLWLWVSGLGPSSVETTPEKISSRSTFPRGWELGFIGGEKSKPPSGMKGSQPACVLKPLFVSSQDSSSCYLGSKTK